MNKYIWSHIFPDNISRDVIVFVQHKDIVKITWVDGSLLERVDYDDVIDSIEQNVAIHGMSVFE